MIAGRSWIRDPSPRAALVAFLAPILGAALAAGALRPRGGERAAEEGEPIYLGEPYREMGDLEAIRARGRLRVLAERASEDYLPRDVDPLFRLRELARGFGRELRAPAVLVPVDSFEALIPALVEGRGDIIATNLTVTPSRKRRVAFTVPLATTREQIVARTGDAPGSEAELAGRSLAVQRNTSFWDRARDLTQRVRGLRLEPLPAELTREEILDLVAEGGADLTIEDSNVLDVALGYRPELRAAFEVSGDQAIAWAVRRGNPRLLGALNAYLQRERLTREQSLVYKEDLPDIRKRGRLRVITRNNAASYFLWRGELRGFEYELVREFARRHRLRVEPVVANSHADLLPLLLQGRGDLVAASLNPTDSRRGLGVAFSLPYNYASQQVVVRAAEKGGLNSPRDLAGRTVVVRPSSAYWASVAALQETGLSVKLAPAPESFDVEEVIDRVAGGEYDLTVVDSHLLALELIQRDDVAPAFELTGPQPHGWAVRATDAQLLRALDGFWAREFKGPFYEVVYGRYFRSSGEFAARQGAAGEPAGPGRFTEWDDAVRQIALANGFDWRLVVALMYQESRFDPDAESWAGAQGLLQVMPLTARELGYRDLRDPVTNIRAGTRYLAQLRERFAPELYAEDRIWFAIAAYNAGLGHVLDAQRIARQQGWNAHRWFGHVENAMRLLSRPEFARQARHGYLSGHRPVAYVRQIRDRYSAYIQLTGQWGGGPEPARIG
jgi:membrane-bound lytic murein transglycosylase F